MSPAAKSDAVITELPWNDEASPQALAAFLEAAAAFERTKPWATASDAQVIGLAAPSVGLTHGCVSVLGAAGQSFGLLVFDSLDDYVAAIHASAAPASQSFRASGAAVVGVHFDDPASLPGGRALAERARSRGWRPGPQGLLPVVVKVGGDGAPLGVADPDYRLATVCLSAVSPFVERNRRLFRPLSTGPLGPPVESRAEVATVSGPVAVILTAPPEVPWEWGREKPLAGLARKDAEALIERFRGACRARGMGETEVAKAAGHVAEAFRHRLSQGRPVAIWTGEEIQEYLLDHYPAKGVAPDEDLALVPESLDAFFAWLATEHAGAAEAIASVRGRIERCRDAFLRYAGDPRRFSQSKTLVRAARAEGVDLADTKAFDAFLKVFRRRLARDPSLLPSAGPVQRKPWVWTPGQPAPDPKGECPCGSGRRYRRCCMPR